MKTLGALLGLALCLLGLLGAWRTPLLTMRSRTLTGPNGRVLELTEHGDRSAPATVICVHSIFQGRETSWPMAQALTRRGLNGVNLHLQAGLEYTDYVQQIRAVVTEYARRGPVFLWGHSMGADLVADAASSDPDVRATVAAGFPVTSPAPELLLVVGLWDQLHSVPEMRQAAQQIHEMDAKIQVDVAVLRASDHNLENFDPASSLVAAGHFGADSQPAQADPFVARGCLAVGLILLAWAHVPGGTRAFSGLCLGVALLSWNSDPYHTVARAVLVCMMVSHGRNWLLTQQQTCALLLSLGAGLVVVAWPNWSMQPAWLLDLPRAAALLVPCLYLKFTSGVPALAWLVLWALEAWRPGWVTRTVCWLPTTSWRKLGGLTWQAPSQVTPAQLALLGLLLLGAGGAWWQVAQAGYWPDGDQWKMLATKVGGLVLIPLLVWVAAAQKFGKPPPKGI